MIEIKTNKIKLDAFYTIASYPFHSEIKDDLLHLISEQPSTSVKQVDSYYKDIISKYDFDQCNDWSRPWVNYFAPRIKPFCDATINSIGYKQCSITSMWFQQYSVGNTHGWHVHDATFSCVYFLEMSDNCGTELINPFNQNDKLVLDVKEGDLLMIPSFVIHRSPVNKNRKTSLAFNIVVDVINDDIINNLRKYDAVDN